MNSVRDSCRESNSFDHDAAHDLRQTETNDGPVEAGRAPPPALPPVHPLAAIGVFAFDKIGVLAFKQVFLGRKKSSFAIRPRHPAAPDARSISSVKSISHKEAQESRYKPQKCTKGTK